MAYELGSVIARVTADITDFQEKMNTVAQTTRQTSDGATEVSKKMAVGLAALSGVAFGLASKATLTAARTETLGIAMEAVAKSTGTSLGILREQETVLKKQGITTQEARLTLTKFMQSQLDVADAAKIARVAQDLAVIAGENSSQTTARLTDAIATMNPELLRQVGIVQNSEEIFNRYGETIGKSGDELTEIEKKQALVNTILQEGEKVAGTYEAAMDTAGKKLGSLSRHFQEAENVIGVHFLPIFGVMIDALTEGLKMINTENIERFFNFLKENKDVLMAVAVGITAMLVPAFIAWTIAAGAAALATLNATWPLLALGAAVAVLAYIIIHNWDWIKSSTLSLVDNIKFFFSSMWDRITMLYSDGLNTLKNIGSKIFDAIKKPFEDAWHKVSDIVNKIKNALDFTKKHSPSTVDIVERGVKLVNNALDGLATPIMPKYPLAGIGSAQGGSMTNVGNIQIDMSGAIISDELSAMRAGEKIGDAIINRLKNNVRF